MPRFSQTLLCLTAIPLILSVSPSRRSSLQDQAPEHIPTRTATPTDSSTQHEISITKLSDPVYPRLALQTGQFGDVQLQLTIRPDGTIESAEVLKGPPLLRDAALASAKNSTFTCQNCEDGPTFYLMTYTFKPGPTINCSFTPTGTENALPEVPYPHVSSEKNHITIIDRPVSTCDTSPELGSPKVRSIKCLYLWRCAHLRNQNLAF